MLASPPPVLPEALVYPHVAPVLEPAQDAAHAAPFQPHFGIVVHPQDRARPPVVVAVVEDALQLRGSPVRARNFVQFVQSQDGHAAHLVEQFGETDVVPAEGVPPSLEHVLGLGVPRPNPSL